ncbi:hypothetical protein [Luteimonas sp. A501]
MRKTTLVFIATSALALSACSKDAGNADTTAANADAAAPSGLLGAAADKAKVESAAAALPQPDANKPVSEYPQLEGGNQIMFHYVAASKLPPDYAKLAEPFSKEYRSTSDTFRRNDLLQAIRPQLDQQIAQAAANPYGWMKVSDANLGSYDFDRKGFAVGEFADSTTRYFNDNYGYKIGWSNYNQLAFAPVADEAAARRIESMRTGYNDRPQLKVHFFAQSADLNDQKVNAVVTHVQITDKSGRVLASYGPDGSVPADVPADDDCQGDAATCAAAHFGF